MYYVPKSNESALYIVQMSILLVGNISVDTQKLVWLLSKIPSCVLPNTDLVGLTMLGLVILGWTQALKLQKVFQPIFENLRYFTN